MSEKRALIVDDSKSARLVLKRMLEKLGMAVDAVESANEALDYLHRNRPDVVFMDHMMPGMDGFEAVSAIKANPATATIPVMMFTSKGGDLYLGQARALGAVGVLPKTVAPAEVFDALCKIGLMRDRRQIDTSCEEDHASERAADRRATSAPEPVPEALAESPPPPIDVAALTHDVVEAVRVLLDEQRNGLRKDMRARMEEVAQTGTQRVHDVLDGQLDDIRDGVFRMAARPLWPVALLVIPLLASVAWNVVLLRERVVATPEVAATTVPPVSSSTSPQPAQAPSGDTVGQATVPAMPGPVATWDTVTWAMNQDLAYDWNELALDGHRTAVIETLLTKLHDAGYEGRVVIETQAGRFCLSGNRESGFRLPAPDQPLSDCEFMGNPAQPTDTPGAHQSLQFANLMTSSPSLADRRIEVEIVSRPRDKPRVAYPSRGTARAAEWNRVAAANNRIAIQLVPRP